MSTIGKVVAIIASLIGLVILIHNFGQAVEWFSDNWQRVKPKLIRFRNTRPMGSLLTFLVVGVSIGGVAGLSLWVWLGRQTESESFRAEVRSGFVSDAGPLTSYMVAYQSMFGDTVSPIFYLTYFEITNLQDVPSRISEFKVEAAKTERGDFEELIPIPLTSTRLYWVGPNSATQPKRLMLNRGTYRLGTQPARDEMKTAMLVIPPAVLQTRMAQTIPPHDSINGWAAFDSRQHRGLSPGQIFFRITVRDTAGKRQTNVIPLPLRRPEDNSLMEANDVYIDTTGQIFDISGFTVRNYGDPYPSPKSAK